MTDATTTEKAKVTRVKRVAIEGFDHKIGGNQIVGTVKFMGHEIDLGDLPTASIGHVLTYGITQVLQDALAGEEDKAAAAEAIVAKLTSGDFTRSRSAQGPTMQSVAAKMVTQVLRAQLGKAPTAELVKAAATKVLDEEGNPKGYAAVKAQYDKERADWEALQGLDLGI